jgi:hypothetical protein
MFQFLTNTIFTLTFIVILLFIYALNNFPCLRSMNNVKAFTALTNVNGEGDVVQWANTSNSNEIRDDADHSGEHIPKASGEPEKKRSCK